MIVEENALGSDSRGFGQKSGSASGGSGYRNNDQYNERNNGRNNTKNNDGYRDRNNRNEDGYNGDVDMRTHVPLDGKKYVDDAEGVIRKLADKKAEWRDSGLLSTSKIRNLLSMITSLYDEVRRERKETLSEEEQSRIQYIRLHFAYEAGRDTKVKSFVYEADIFSHIQDIGNSKERFLLFCRYMEALVAYHRYYGGKE